MVKMYRGFKINACWLITKEVFSNRTREKKDVFQKNSFLRNSVRKRRNKYELKRGTNRSKWNGSMKNASTWFAPTDFATVKGISYRKFGAVGRWGGHFHVHMRSISWVRSLYSSLSIKIISVQNMNRLLLN